MLRMTADVSHSAPLGRRVRVCTLTELSSGEARRLDLNPPVAVFHTDDGELYAIDDTCTHQDASLADGWLEGCEVECPLHASRFDLRTGKVDAPPAKKPVRTHEVSVDGGDVYITLSDAAPNLPPGVGAPAGPSAGGPP